MLDATTKRNIDAARDVLVGKVPDPKAQVEQITTALIYKFMDDLDKESLRLGGKAKFFSGEYEKYSWSNLVDTRLSGEARLGLYVQAITSMDKNPSLPQLFRDIFKGAFLPYNDPQTLSLFLKEINKFTYNHSEELGNAFEYLLSIMSSQGAAGQFRTPRHIIDFMVAVVDPQKNETILDPACGTAGFLISSFKHIRKHNSSNFDENNGIGGGLAETADQTFLQDDPLYRGDLLTQDERRRLMENIQGYDISPDMVRLSLVNLYLHGFPSPNIFEYDTLSSEDRWNETFDVILANPPFMTPKGGIRPHKRFQVQANRSEVLFVDYILEHLNVNGRAGIIVPEGIIFKTENAYKRLRKLLVEDGLYAVVSLPSGVFQPYSGVKTSILFFDNQFAKRVDEILFVKIEHDGFDLGAQRNRIESNDLPSALEILQSWEKGKKQETSLGLWVKKEKLSKDGEFNLSRDRYQEVTIRTRNKWPIVELGEVAEIISGQSPKSEYYNEEKIGTPFFQGKTEFGSIYLCEPVKWTTSITKLSKPGDILMSVRAPVGPVNINTQEICIGRGLAAIRPNKIDGIFLFYILRTMEDKIKGSGGSVFDSINNKQISQIKIPLPPLEMQKEIVEQIEVKQAAIDAAKAVIENLEKNRRFFGRELNTINDVKWVLLGDVCKTSSGGTPLRDNPENYVNGKIPWLKSGEVSQGLIYSTEEKITERGLKESSAKIFPVGTVLIAMYGATAGRVGLLKIESSTNQAICGILPSENFVPEFLYFYLYTLTDKMVNLSSGGAQPNISQKIIRGLEVPLISLDYQEKIVSGQEMLEENIESNHLLIQTLSKKIENILNDI